MTRVRICFRLGVWRVTLAPTGESRSAFTQAKPDPVAAGLATILKQVHALPACGHSQASTSNSFAIPVDIVATAFRQSASRAITEMARFDKRFSVAVDKEPVLACPPMSSLRRRAEPIDLK